MRMGRLPGTNYFRDIKSYPGDFYIGYHKSSDVHRSIDAPSQIRTIRYKVRNRVRMGDHDDDSDDDGDAFRLFSLHIGPLASVASPRSLRLRG